MKGKKFFKDLLFIIIVSAIWVAVWFAIRDAIWTNYNYPGGRGTREVTVERTSAAVEDEAEGVRLFDVYEEGSGPAPAWYRPDEPMAAEWSAAEDYILDVPLDAEFQRYLHDLCEENGVPYTLAVAVIEAESTYRADAVSPGGDYGLMQINRVCHAWLADELGITDFLDPYQNARAGVFILGMYYRQYGAESGTLIAYNMGQAAAERLFAAGVYETDYSRRVIGIRWRLEHEASR